jgi:hypothetical protein
VECLACLTMAVWGTCMCHAQVKCLAVDPVRGAIKVSRKALLDPSDRDDLAAQPDIQYESFNKVRRRRRRIMMMITSWFGESNHKVRHSPSPPPRRKRPEPPCHSHRLPPPLV